jgi:hypothetical protein
VFVAYSQVGSDFVIMKFGHHPSVSEKEVQRAGDLIDAALELEALKNGVKQLLIVPSGKTTAEFVRDYKVKPFVAGLGVNTKPIAYVN